MGGRHLENKQQYYKLVLDDYATPSFISWYKDFFGTLDEISELIEALKTDRRTRESHQQTIDAFESFLNGNTEAEHIVAYNRQRLLTPVEIIKSSDTFLQTVIWDHSNVWDCIYRMKTDAVNVQRAIFKTDGSYVIGIKVHFQKLYYQTQKLDSPDKWNQLKDGFWGFPKLFDISEDILRYRLYTAMNRYPDLCSAEEDFADEDQIDFKQIIDDVFGDG